MTSDLAITDHGVVQTDQGLRRSQTETLTIERVYDLVAVATGEGVSIAFTRNGFRQADLLVTAEDARHLAERLVAAADQADMLSAGPGGDVAS